MTKTTARKPRTKSVVAKGGSKKVERKFSQKKTSVIAKKSRVINLSAKDMVDSVMPAEKVVVKSENNSGGDALESVGATESIVNPVIVENHVNTAVKPTKKRASWVVYVLIVLLVSVLTVTAILVVRFVQGQNDLAEMQKKLDSMKAQESVSDKSIAEEAKLVVERYIDIGLEEIPSIIVVKDTNILAQQQYFEKVKAGDVILIYTVAKRAVVYRPSTEKVIDLIPLTYSE